MYKLRIYKSCGNLDHEEYFETKTEMDNRYNELFRRELYGLNPTAWEQIENDRWKRLGGY